MKKRTNRQKAIIRRNIFLSLCVLVLVLVIAFIGFIIKIATSKPQVNGPTPTSSSSSEVSSQEPVSEVSSSEPAEQFVKLGEYTLDANYSNLLLVNGENPLPKDYDYEGNLTTIPQKYIKGSLTQFDKDTWPYLQAMLDAAKKDGVDMGVWSPYRSYAIQEMLFKRQINKQISNGVKEEDAEEKAATVVARPGTSEHHTGLALDINSASASFEKTPAFDWLKENAQDYGFILRYPSDKQEITGVIYESWHWRFVGINAAKEINDLDMCLEEYLEHKSNS